MADLPTQTQRLALHDVDPRGRGRAGIRATWSSALSGVRKWIFRARKKKLADVSSKFMIPSRPYRLGTSLVYRLYSRNRFPYHT